MIPIIEDVYKRYMADVRNHDYPGPEHTVYMKDEEREKFKKLTGWQPKTPLGPGKPAAYKK